MPEGPEIRRAADGLAAVLLDRPLTSVWFGHQRLKHYEPVLEKSIVTDVTTKGKALLTRFDCGLTIYSHNQLYGRWYVEQAGQRPATKRTLRLAIETASDAALLYSASDITVLPDEALWLHPFLRKAGIDVLSDHPTTSRLADFMRQPRFARRQLGGLLLDQGFVAGVGNYLRSEILFCARLHPQQRLTDLNGHQSRRLAHQTIQITRRAYQTGGITNDPTIVRRLVANGWTRSRYRHLVFARAGARCHRCNSKINKTIIAGRRLYLCPRCQARP